jgi:pimeloyl-ACP methyl ester carboxylesterase
MSDVAGRTEGSAARRRAGVVGAVVGIAAAGLAAGVAVERVLTRRGRSSTFDPHAKERLGPQPYDESRVITTADGVNLYVEIVDPADGVALEPGFSSLGATGKPSPTLVFIHGFCLDMGTFYFQRQELTRLGDYRMVFYDQPGHGRSGKLPSGEYSLESLGEALHRVIEEAAPDEQVVLIGHSMGGMAIMALAEMHPHLFGDRVVGVALIATSAGRLEATRFGLPEILARAGRPLLPLLDNATRVTGTMVDRARAASVNVATLLTRRYGFGTARPSPALVSFVERMNSGTATETVARYLRTLYTHARYPALEALREIPVLVICGDKDPITPPSHSAEICRRVPDAHLVTVPDSGHVVLLEHAEVVNEELLEFLEKVSA